jgi:hypothetical protein
LLHCFLTACGDSGIVDEKGGKIYDMEFKVKKVKVDGDWYYASRTYGGYWVLGPRVPEEVLEKK